MKRELTLSVTLACGACGAEPPPAKPVVATHRVGLPAATSASAPASDAPTTPTTAHGLSFEVVLDGAKLPPLDSGGDAEHWELGTIAEGLLVVRNLPPKAYLVGPDGKVTPKPGLFVGLTSPDPGSPADYFQVYTVTGSLSDLSFTLDAPSTGFFREVHGKAGSWRFPNGKKGSMAKPASYIDERLIANPITLKSGARLYERASSDSAEASKGFTFAFVGPARGQSIPKAAPGTNGCKFHLLGHPFLKELSDGRWVGVSTACTKGDDPLATVKLEGNRPYLGALERMSPGHLAVEVWNGNESTAVELPGAGAIADFAGAEIVEPKPGRVYVVSKVAGSKGDKAYVARLDGASWVDATPRDAPADLFPMVTGDGSLFLLSSTISFRDRDAGWSTIRGRRRSLLRRGPGVSCMETADGAIYFESGSQCVWQLEHGNGTAVHLLFGKGQSMEEMASVGTSAYFVLQNEKFVSSLVRVVR